MRDIKALRGLDPRRRPLPICADHLGNAFRFQCYLLACPTLWLGIVALTNIGAGIDTTRWARLQPHVLHLTLGTPTPAPTFNPVEVNAALVILGALLLKALSLIPLVGRPHGVGSPWLAVVGALGSLAMLWGYAPARLGCHVPLASLWAGAPELGLATLANTALAVVVAVVVTRRVSASRRRDAG